MLQQMLQRFLQHRGSTVSYGRFIDGAHQPRCRAPATPVRNCLRRNAARLVPMPDTFSTRYAALIAAGKIEADPGQAMLAAQLTALAHRLDQHRLARKSSSLGWLFGQREHAGPPRIGLY